MAKTRSQSLHASIKKEEECEDKSRLEKLIHSTHSLSKTKNTVSKNKIVKASSVLAKTVNVNSEYTASPERISTSPWPVITEEQIEELIHCIVNDNMSVGAASEQAGMSKNMGRQYYRKYREDPEHKIPLPKTRFVRCSTSVSQKKIENLIQYIVHDNMGVAQAACKAGIATKKARIYYEKYKADPDHKVPALGCLAGVSGKHCTQEQVNKLIGYIANDDLSVAEASEKAGMSKHTGRMYYNKYINDPARKTPLVSSRNFSSPHKEYTIEQVTSLIHYITKEDMNISEAGRQVGISSDCAGKFYSQYLMSPNHDIPDPKEWVSRRGKLCTNDKVKQLIGHIVDDGMTLLKASAKVNLSSRSATRYYRKYLEDPQRNIPTPEDDPTCNPLRRATISQVRDFFTHLIVDKLSAAEAARKVNLSEAFGHKYERIYFQTREPKTKAKMPNLSYTVEKMKKMVEYIQKDKMVITAACRKAELGYRTGQKYYAQYLKDPKHEIPVIDTQTVYITQEQITKLIHHIVHDRMSVKRAARKVKMGETRAYKYYNTFRDDPERKMPAPIPNGYKKKTDLFNRYLQIIADIYKNNPSIKPTCKYLSSPDFGIKNEFFKQEIKKEMSDSSSIFS